MTADCTFSLKCRHGVTRVTMSAPSESPVEDIELHGMSAITYSLSWCAAQLAIVTASIPSIHDPQLAAQLRSLAEHLLAASDPTD